MSEKPEEREREPLKGPEPPLDPPGSGHNLTPEENLQAWWEAYLADLPPRHPREDR